MNRRQFLAGSATGLGAVLAGCSRLGGTTTLGSPEERLDDDGMEKHLRYDDDGTRVAVVSLDQTARRESPTDPFQFRLHVAHRSSEQRYDRSTTIDRFRFDLRAPPASVKPPADVYLRSPSGGPWSEFQFEQVEDFWTRIAVSDVGVVGEGTLTLSTLVRPRSLPVDELGFRATVELSEEGLAGTRYVVQSRTRFEPITAE